MRQLTDTQYRLAFFGGIVLLVVLVLYIFLGFAVISFPDQKTSGVYVNGQLVGTGLKHIKLRPGSYTITYSSAENDPVTRKITVLPFFPTTFAPASSGVDFTKAAAKATGLGGNGAFDFSNVKRFGDVWVAGVVDLPSESEYLVMKYEQGAWDQIYYGDGTDADFKLVVPPAIQSYLLALPDTTVGAGNGN